MPHEGRSRRSDGEATRARLVESAGELIAERGYAETTGKAIAAHAKVDLASINYHFGNRDGLYRAVLVEAHSRFVQLKTLDDIASQNMTAREKLRALIATLFLNFRNTEHWHIRILMREMVSPSSQFGVLREEVLPPKLNVAMSVISEITGIPPEDPYLFYSLFSCAAPCIVLMLSGPSLIAEDRPSLPPEALIDHLHRFALAGLEAVAQQARTR